MFQDGYILFLFVKKEYTVVNRRLRNIMFNIDRGKNEVLAYLKNNLALHNGVFGNGDVIKAFCLINKEYSKPQMMQILHYLKDQGYIVEDKHNPDKFTLK